MEGHDPSSQRQYAQNPYAAQQSQPTNAQVSGQYAAPASAERFRHPSSYLQQSPTTPSSLGRAGGDAQQVYGYQQSAQYGSMPGLQQSSMQYAQNFQAAQDPQRQTQQANYPQYGAGVMYGNLAQPQSQQPQTPSVYEQAAQYRQRPSSHSETLATGFGVPQTAQYYLAPQSVPTSAPATDLTGGQLTSSYQQSAYQQPGPSAQQAYSNTMIDPAQTGAYATYPQQSQYSAQQTQPTTQTQTVDQAFNDYQARVRSIFTLVRDGNLRDIGSHLLNISQYLLGNAEALGLTRDDDTLHDDRIRLWDEFNRAWLSTLQRQFDMTEEVLQTNQALREPQSIMTTQSLEHLSRELIRSCDSVERHGLVDYQMGVAEEEIMELLLRCLDLMDPSTDRSDDTAAQAESSTSAGARSR